MDYKKLAWKAQASETYRGEQAGAPKCFFFYMKVPWSSGFEMVSIDLLSVHSDLHHSILAHIRQTAITDALKDSTFLLKYLYQLPMYLNIVIVTIHYLV